jgi:RNA polymerase sigma factor (sigma-70 family)
MEATNVEHLLRTLAPQVLGALIRRYRDFGAAEDAVQEALLAASTRWSAEGTPDNPKAWLITVASRRMADQVRSDLARRKRETEIGVAAGYILPHPSEHDSDEDDDTLVLIYMCCHPALPDASAIALTLRAVGGLTTAEIARAFLTPEPTMAQRITRAKQTIKASGTPFRLPESRETTERLAAVLHVLYLIFSEGYTASHGEQLQRRDLASEAIRLARLVHARLPQNAEVGGLLALMLLTDARRHARTGAQGEAIPIDEQDRSLWDRELIDEGIALLSRALRQGEVGPYQLQASIAAVHDEARSDAETEWPQILALYNLLERISANPVVRLNRTVAVAMVKGPREALPLLDELETDDRMRDHHRLHAVRAHLLEMAGDPVAAMNSYRAALSRVASTPERNYLLAKLARLGLP